MATSGLDMKGSKIPGELGCVNTDGKDCVDTEGGLTDEDLQDLHEDILDRNEDGVRSLLTEFLEQDLPVDTLCCTEVELEPATHDHILNWLPLSGLHRAALINSHGILDAILSSVPDIDINLALKKSGYTALHVAASAGVLAAVNYLTSSGACVEARDSEGSTAMHMAAQNGHKDVLSLLCVRGASVNVQNTKGETPLHMAAEAGYRETSDFLLNKDAGVNVKDISGLTPLHAAQFKGHATITERLLDKGADVHACDKCGNSPVHTWILNKTKNGKDCSFLSSTSLAILLRRNYNVNKPNQDGDACLHLATATGDAHLTEFLINQGSAINQLNNLGRSPIFASRSVEVTDILVAGDADVNLRDTKGNCVLHCYAHHDDASVLMMKSVICQGVDVNMKNSHGQTPLHGACSSGNRSKIELLLSSGARNDVVDNQGHSILHTSLIKAGQQQSMWLLSKNGISITQQDRSGNTLLHLAAASGNTSVVEYLLSRNVQVSTNNHLGHTAATMAAHGDHFESLRIILLRGGAIDPHEGARVLLKYIKDVDVDVVDQLLDQVDCNKELTDEGHNALQLALLAGSRDLSSMLLDSKADIYHLDTNGASSLHITCERLYTCPQLENLIPRLIAPALCSAFDAKKNTPLHLGIAACSEETLELFLSNGFNPILQDANGKTVAHHLIRSVKPSNPTDNSALSKLEVLLGKCPECVSKRDEFNETLLHAAVKFADLDMTNLLLHNQADVNALNDGKVSPLHCACTNGHLKMASLLLHGQANPNLPDTAGRTAMFQAMLSECAELVQLMLVHGANVNVQDVQGKTCLMVAMENKLSDLCTEVLLESTPDHSFKDVKGSTLLHYAARYCTHEVVDILLDQGADINAVDVHLASPLHTSITNSDEGVLASLLSAEVGVNMQDHMGNTALHLCSEVGSYKHVKRLLDNETVNVEIPNNLGRTATHLAAMARDSDVIELLIANEADIDITDAEGNTPLALSIMEDNIDNSSDLLDQGADVSIKNSDGDTALHHAMRMHSPDRQLLKLMVHRGKCCLESRNIKDQTPQDVLLSREDIDVEAVALDIGLDL